MDVSSALCREQQLFHENRAAASDLENVRAVASKAAAAWGLEAAAAERREQRRKAGASQAVSWPTTDSDDGEPTPGSDS